MPGCVFVLRASYCVSDVLCRLLGLLLFNTRTGATRPQAGSTVFFLVDHARKFPLAARAGKDCFQSVQESCMRCLLQCKLPEGTKPEAAEQYALMRQSLHTYEKDKMNEARAHKRAFFATLKSALSDCAAIQDFTRQELAVKSVFDWFCKSTYSSRYALACMEFCNACSRKRQCL
jgi:hypothetical protein